jgi:hypothetical protein
VRSRLSIQYRQFGLCDDSRELSRLTNCEGIFSCFVFVAPGKHSRQIRGRMKSVLFRAGLSAIGAGLFLCVSCEEHHLGEYPEVQRDRLAEARQANRVEEDKPPATSPTPVEFFPEKKSP